jgi:hypothetical protein
MSPAQRRETARQAAQSRWKKKRRDNQFEPFSVDWRWIVLVFAIGVMAWAQAEDLSRAVFGCNSDSHFS